MPSIVSIGTLAGGKRIELPVPTVDQHKPTLPTVLKDSEKWRKCTHPDGPRLNNLSVRFLMGLVAKRICKITGYRIDKIGLLWRLCGFQWRKRAKAKNPKSMLHIFARDTFVESHDSHDWR